MKSSIDYNCKLCGKPGTAEYDPAMVQRLERWIPLLHCNRCADYKVMLRKLRDQAKRLAIFRWQLKSAASLTTERDDGIRSKLSVATKAISLMVCDYWLVQTVWEPDFVEQLLDFPDKAEFIVNHYATMIQEKATEVHTAACYGIRNTMDNPETH